MQHHRIRARLGVRLRRRRSGIRSFMANKSYVFSPPVSTKRGPSGQKRRRAVVRSEGKTDECGFVLTFGDVEFAAEAVFDGALVDGERVAAAHGEMIANAADCDISLRSRDVPGPEVAAALDARTSVEWREIDADFGIVDCNY
jgi:hypothetical protein